ncbi:MAG: menaquinone biosynthesis protein [Panacibacter sp.]
MCDATGDAIATKAGFIKNPFSLHAKIDELEKIKVGAVSYLNTKPLLYGIRRSVELMEMIELVEDYPAKIAAMLVDGTIDVGLAPVAVIPRLKEWHIVSDYCIGADREVASVCLFSDVPVDKIERILLDYQSRTSVSLCKVLLKHFWKIEPVIEEAKEHYIKEIKGTTAGVVIGDRALIQRKISPYIYDLAGSWKKMTGLPFVFAAWIANKKLPENFIELFNAANALGMTHIDDVIAENSCPVYDLKTYYTTNISYTLDEQKLKGMDLFLEYLKVSEPVIL